MDRKTLTGFLLLADISGYTSFVARTEIEHADQAISILLEAVIEKLSALLTISKLEGDAVCTYLADDGPPGGAAILALIDDTYRAFRDQADTLYTHATCSCNACRAIPSLDLKFMVHHGQFIIQQIAGIKDLLGADVNLVHRLMKNHVAETTGWQGYALFTAPGLDAIHADRAAFVQQIETYEHIGDVPTFILDLHPRYASPQSS
jgi:class 3 adenylate cyclase